MIELTTQSIDDLWRRTYGTGGGTTEKTNISASATRFYNDLHKLWNWANEKNYEKFYSNISESSLETILNVGSLISDNKIIDTFNNQRPQNNSGGHNRSSGESRHNTQTQTFNHTPQQRTESWGTKN